MSSRLRVLHEWMRQVEAILPGVRVTRARGQALFAAGMLGANSVTMLRVAATLPLEAADSKFERRLLPVHLALWWGYGLGLWVVRSVQRRRGDRPDRRDLSLLRLGQTASTDALDRVHPPVGGLITGLPRPARRQYPLGLPTLHPLITPFE